MSRLEISFIHACKVITQLQPYVPAITIAATTMETTPSRRMQNSNAIPFPLLLRSSCSDLQTVRAISTGVATSHDYHQQTCICTMRASTTLPASVQTRDS
ncbi:hypothetical protein DEO72_LG11g1808 [Vigna unguiculata]|uniref:Uncharacterized protein n=1 Tax=Vigna unguiculata TaxID=3917 RepID=A0A4D6NP64_VIGUN|nr:hypothetical protein DEO72_LG11g1808 [Vigna unguiculata]